MQNISELGRWWRSSLAKQPVAITQAYLSSLKEERGKEKLNFVGVHVRRTDYIQLMKTYYQMFEAVDEHFFHHCMAEYRRKLGPDTLFLVTSDDIPWCRSSITQRILVHFKCCVNCTELNYMRNRFKSGRVKKMFFIPGNIWWVRMFCSQICL